MTQVVVVGGGVVGLFSARALALAGHAVTVLDSKEFSQGCSHGNSGLIVPSHFVPLASPGIVAQGIKWLADPTSPFRIKPSLSPRLAKWGWLFQRSCTHENVRRARPLLRDLALESLAAYRRLAEDGLLSAGFRDSGLVMACMTPTGLEEEREVAAQAAELGLPVSVLGRDEARSVLPGFAGEGAVVFPEDGQLDPGKLMTALFQELSSLGVKLESRVEVKALNLGSSTVNVLAGDGREFHADHVVVAAGALSSHLVRGLGRELPLVGGKGYSFMAPQPSPMIDTPVILVEDRVALSPLGTGVRLGGTLEIGTDPNEADPRRIEGIARAVERAFPSFQVARPAAETVWRGQRPCSPDGLPYIGRFNEVANLTIATGHAMLGVTLAPATARLVVESVSGAPVLPLLDPGRFG